MTRAPNRGGKVAHATVCVVLTVASFSETDSANMSPRLLVLLAAASTSHALNVHIVAHTHDDVGWLKSVGDLYTGLHNEIQRASVKAIISSVVNSLARDPARRFVYCESSFFEMWWSDQADATRALTRQLVASGQLEFVNGGWSMHDNTDGTRRVRVTRATSIACCWGGRARARNQPAHATRICFPTTRSASCGRLVC